MTTSNKELWENTTPSRLWLTLTNENGRTVSTRVDGHGRVLVNTSDRIDIESLRPAKNPFISGRLRRIDDGATEAQASAALTDEQLAEKASLGIRAFKKYCAEASELEVRRLSAIMKGNEATTIQKQNTIDEIILERWPHVTLESVQDNPDEPFFD